MFELIPGDASAKIFDNAIGNRVCLQGDNVGIDQLFGSVYLAGVDGILFRLFAVAFYIDIQVEIGLISGGDKIMRHRESYSSTQNQRQNNKFRVFF